MFVNKASFINSVFDSFNCNNIDYCILRNYHGLPEDHGNDIDILVNQSESIKARQLLADTALEHNYVVLKNIYRHGYVGVYLINRDTLEIILFDFYLQILIKGIPIADTHYILQSKTKFRNFFIPTEGCEVAVTLPKELLMFGHVKKRDQTRIRIAHCVTSDSVNFKKTLYPYFGIELTNQLADLAKEQAWDEIATLSGKLRKKAMLTALKRHPIRQLGNWFIFLANHLKLLCWDRPGIFISLIGPDGSGKTTVTNIIKKHLYESIYKKIHFIHKDFAILPQLKSFKKLFFLEKGKDQEDKPTQKYCGMVIPHSSLRGLFYVNYYFLDFMLGHFVVSFLKWKNGIIIADRYFYDYFYQLAYVNVPKWYLLILSKFIPKPDIILCLNANSEKIHARKPELTISEIDRQMIEIKKLSCILSNCIHIETDCSPAQTEKNVLEQVFRFIARK